ncbi:hypothetical protein ASG92_21355 [Arthrobacter sp. Soil736]|uniref:hypothetical protein n=1 Tax=Arthrobacter sp. Soil736 TaxID=1736395 RepID=UPI0006FAB075|nr:hypothetical protein [Arthrobacter sp. Soil736]KRE60505.1 hypothetical protein ASG92_21355 [Arthrobacter sp. Soil736]
MDYSTTVALNVTFLATLAAAFVFFLWHVLLFTGLLVLAGAGRLAALILKSLVSKGPRKPASSGPWRHLR